MTKEELERLAEKSSNLQEGTYTPQHKTTYIHGFIDGYNSCNKWINGDVIPNLNEDEDYKEFIVIENEEVITGIVFSKRDGYFISHFDTSDCPRKRDVKLYIELPKKP